MSKFLFTNNAKSTLASGITAVATSLFVQTGEGALFPSPGAGEQFALTLVDSSSNIEVVYCTSRTGDTLTIVRAQEGTTGIAFNSGDAVELRLTKGVMESMMQSYDNIEAGTEALFVQSAAPTGWTQNNTNHDRVIRVVDNTGTGAATGGNWTLSGMSVDGHTLVEAEIPSHTHSASSNSAGDHRHNVSSYSASKAGADKVYGNTSGNKIGPVDIGTAHFANAGSHSHTITVNNTGGGGSHNHGLTNTSWRPSYVDVINCTKD